MWNVVFFLSMLLQAQRMLLQAQVYYSTPTVQLTYNRRHADETR